MKLGLAKDWRSFVSSWLWTLRTKRPNFVAAIFRSSSDRALRVFEVGLRLLTLFAFGSAIAYFFDPSGPISSAFTETALTALTVLPIYLLVAYFLIQARTELKIRRDAAASSILEKVSAGRPVKFSLYLRSFEGDTRIILEDNPLKNPLNYILSQIDFQPGDPLERMLIRTMRRIMPLIKLGNQGEALDFDVGTLAYETGDPRWFDDFQILASAATQVFILPLARRGSDLMKEIEWLHEQKMQGKVCFVMPPKLRVKFKKTDGSLFEERHLSEMWSEVSRLLESSLGHRLPRYRPTGGMVFWDRSNYCFGTAEYGSAWNTRRVFERTISSDLQAYSPRRTAISITKRALFLDLMFFVCIGVAGIWPEVWTNDPTAALPTPIGVFLLGVLALCLWRMLLLSLQFFQIVRALLYFTVHLILPLIAFLMGALLTRTIYAMVSSFVLLEEVIFDTVFITIILVLLPTLRYATVRFFLPGADRSE